MDAAIIRRRRFVSGGPAPDTTAPTVSSAVLASDGVTLTVTFDEALDTGNDTAVGEWAMSASSTTTSVSTAAIDTGSTTDVTLTLGTAVTDSETMTVDYSGTSLRDAVGNQVATFTGQAVTNNSTQTGSTPPASLFASGEPGAWYDPSDLSTLYQDSAGTTAVTADGDPVGYMGDKSGNGNHATQSTSAARPVYRTDGTLHWLEFDGVDDSLVAPMAIAAQPITAHVAGHITDPSAKTFQRFFDGDARVLIGKQSSTESTIFAGTTLTFSDSFSKNVYTGKFDGASSVARFGGAQTATGDAGTNSLNTKLIIGAERQQSIEHLAGNIYGLIVRGIASSQNEIDQTESYLADESGVTL